MKHPLSRKLPFLYRENKPKTLLEEEKQTIKAIKNSLFFEYKIIKPVHWSILAIIAMIIGGLGVIGGYIVLTIDGKLELGLFSSDPGINALCYGGVMIVFALILAVGLFDITILSDAKIRRLLTEKGIPFERKKEYIPLIEYIEENFPFQQLKIQSYYHG